MPLRTRYRIKPPKVPASDLFSTVYLLLLSLTVVVIEFFGCTEFILLYFSIPVIISALYYPRKVYFFLGDCYLIISGIIISTRFSQSIIMFLVFVFLLGAFILILGELVYRLAEKHREVERSLLRKIQAMESLRKVTSRVISQLNLDKLLREIMEQAANLLRVSRGELAVYRPETGDLEVVVSNNLSTDTTKTIIAMGTGAMGMVAETSQPLYIEDYGAWEDALPELKDGMSMSLLLVPIIRGKKFLGVIAVSKPVGEQKFSVDDLELLQFFAGHAGIAIANAWLYSKVETLSVQDPLTGLANRRSFFERGEKELERARRYGFSLGLLMIDIDNFKQINDKEGHQGGDKVLSMVAGRCWGMLRSSDIIGRYGGEEFIVILPETGREEVLHLAERIRLSIEELIPEGIPVTVSIGVVSKQHVTGKHGLYELIKIADSALYRAKAEGRNRVVEHQLS